MAARLAALPGGELPHPLPGRWVPALVVPAERGRARLQRIGKRTSGFVKHLGGRLIRPHTE